MTDSGHSGLTLAYITVPDETMARGLASGLVEAGLAAGVNISGPCASVFFWNGGIRKRQEWQLFAQTANFAGLCDWISERHPDQVPCIACLPISAGLPPFLDWIRRHGRG